MLLGVVIPVFNERELLTEVIDRLDAAPIPVDAHGRAMERVLVVVDDGSGDGTREVVSALNARSGIVTVLHPRNRGKGAAVRTGIDAALNAGADVIIIHDADLEYDPSDHVPVVGPIASGVCDAVIGSRFLGHQRDGMYAWHYVGNAVITLVSNEFSGWALTDIECCLKAFTRRVAMGLALEEPRFGVEPEIIAKLARMTGVRVGEVPVHYRGRSFADGKKISWRDGFAALRCIVKYSLRDDPRI